MLKNACRASCLDMILDISWYLRQNISFSQPSISSHITVFHFFAYSCPASPSYSLESTPLLWRNGLPVHPLPHFGRGWSCWLCHHRNSRRNMGMAWTQEKTVRMMLTTTTPTTTTTTPKQTRKQHRKPPWKQPRKQRRKQWYWCWWWRQ